MEDIQPPLVVAIEPEQSKADHLLLASRGIGATSSEREGSHTRHSPLRGLAMTIVTDPSELAQFTSNPPSLILLHATLGERGWSYEQFFPELKELDFLSRTVLHTNRLETQALKRLNDKVRTKGLRALMLRPLDWRSIEAWAYGDEGAHVSFAQTPGHVRHAHSSLESFADMLSPAIMVLRVVANHEPTVLHSNKSAKSVAGGKLERSDLRRLQLLQSDLIEDAKRAAPTRRARRLDWDSRRGQWVECRLHALDSNHYWYTRDWRNDDAVEEEFASFEDEPYFLARFDRLCNYLAERWGFSRVRLYQLDRAPDGYVRFTDANAESRRDAMPTFEVLAECETSIKWMVVPRSQSGGGLAGWQKSGALVSAGSWWQQSYPWESHVYASPNLAHARSQIRLNDSNQRPILHLEEVAYGAATEPGGAGTSCAPGGRAAVEWGTATHRLTAVIPAIEPLPGGDGTAPEVSPLLYAMLVLDRRHDHLLSTDSLTSKEERERVVLAARAEQVSVPLDDEAKSAFEQGPFRRIGLLLGRWLVDDHERRVRKWHGEISQAIFATFGSMVGGGGMAAMSALCEQLRYRWTGLWMHERRRVGLSSDPTQTPILNWFFAVQRSDTEIELPAGSGALWERYVREAAILSLEEPLRSLLSDRFDPWTIHVVQDHPAEFDRQRRALESSYVPFADDLDQVKSWVAVRLPTPSGFDRAAMILHFGHAPNSLWSTALHLVLLAAQRLYPPFMLAASETHERSQWAAAVVHEIKTEALLIRDGLELLGEHSHDRAAPANSPVADLSLLSDVDGIVELCKDYLRSLDERFEVPDPREMEAGPLNLALAVQKMTATWATRYPTTKFVPVVDVGDLLVQAPALLRRVVRVLLHNAFRHGETWVKLEATRVGDRLRVFVANDAGESAIRQLAALDMHGADSRRAGFVRLRVGLRSAVLLAHSAGGGLKRAVEPAAAGGQLATVCFTLEWPIR